MSEYVPILKWKRGEQNALEHLMPGDRSMTLPLIEVIPDPLELDGDEVLLAAYDKVIRQIRDSWGDAPAFVDLVLLDPDQRAPNDRHPVDFFFERASEAGLRLIPVTGPGRDDEHQEAVLSVQARDLRGACIRVSQDELFEPSLHQDLTDVLNRLELPRDEADLITDFGAIGTHTQGQVAAAALGITNALPNLEQWRRVIFSGSAFPENLAGLGTGLALLERTEWRAWLRIRGTARRAVLFGDYAINHPVYAQVPFPGSAAIRYTIEDDWLIVRGRAVRGGAYGGFTQFRDLSRTLVADQRFCGQDFSWGDDYIARCALGTVGTGNLTTWRAVGTNHHITFVVRQIANLPGA